MSFKDRVKKHLEEGKEPATEEVAKTLIELESEFGDEWDDATMKEVRRLMRQLGSGNIGASRKIVQDMILKGDKVYDELLVAHHLPIFWNKLNKDLKAKRKRK